MSDISVVDEKREASIDMREVVPDGVDEVYRPDVDTSRVDERRLMRRIDFRLIPFLALFYLMNTLDRGAIGNARVRSDATTLLRSLTDTCIAVWYGGRYRVERQAVPDSAHGVHNSILTIGGPHTL